MRWKRIAIVLAVAAAVAAVVAVPAFAVRGDDAKRVSKNGKAEGVISGVHVAVEYGRPSVNGRKIWGGLVPYGQVWRTGANEATTVSFDRDVTIEGKPLAKGTYAFFAIPTEASWTLIFNKTAEQWGAFKYDEKQDALRVSVTPAAHAPVETLTYAVSGDTVALDWEKLEVAFHVAPAAAH